MFLKPLKTINKPNITFFHQELVKASSKEKGRAFRVELNDVCKLLSFFWYIDMLWHRSHANSFPKVHLQPDILLLKPPLQLRVVSWPSAASDMKPTGDGEVSS